MPAQRWAVRIETDDGARGEYVTHWVGTPSSFAQAAMLAPHLLGRDPEPREEIWQDLKREVRAYDHMGHGPLDIALWDLAGEAPRRLGGRAARRLPQALPTYASTYHGQDEPGGLDTPEAFADYAVACKEQGFAGFKIHGWHDGDVAREVANMLRRAQGGRRRLAADDRPGLPAAHLDGRARGRPACDEAEFFWYEDPYRDSGGALEGHKRLRERLKTPLLVCEHVRGLEPKAAFMLAGGGDMIHADPEYDMGITGAMKIAHFCRGARASTCSTTPAARRTAPCMAATPQYPFLRDGADRPRHAQRGPAGLCLRLFRPAGRDRARTAACPSPTGPGLGVTYDWDFIERNRLEHHVFD